MRDTTLDISMQDTIRVYSHPKSSDEIKIHEQLCTRRISHLQRDAGHSERSKMIHQFTENCIARLFSRKKFELHMDGYSMLSSTENNATADRFVIVNGARANVNTSEEKRS
ncbi:hypothetical protein GWI33_010173 [Rhynchophorus ferrugineus]|uniref:Uncharacterized protein n=1 Tax=Rhynchophorus ferrugineus TaxID=354439 RepID=A0A834IV79_RHYFE|nr:hypothetical protein GWI33_010173 [Rhynchophorus ferrugineus]